MINLEKFKKIFLPEPAFYTFWYPQTGYSTEKHRHKNITDKEIELHLQGKQGLSISPFVNNTNVKFGVIDIDVDEFDLVEKIITNLIKLNIYPNLFRSKSKGYHIYIFPEEPIQAKTMTYNLKRAVPDEIRFREAPQENGTIILKEIVEIFPKRETPTEKGGFKNNLPLFGNTRLPLDFKGKEKKSFLPFMTKLKHFKTAKTKREEPTRREEEATKKIGDSYPCMEKISKGVPKGMRIKCGFEFARYLMSLNVPVYTLENEMHRWNKLNNPPLSDSEIKNEILNKLDKDKSRNAPYCNESILKQFCDKKNCKKAEIVLCEDPKLIKKHNGYYMEIYNKTKGLQLLRVTNFTMDIIMANRFIEKITLEVSTIERKKNVLIEKSTPSWSDFVSACGYAGITTTHFHNVSLQFLISAELSANTDKIEETELEEMNFDLLLSFIEEDLDNFIHTPKSENSFQLDKIDIKSGWYIDNVVYLRTGDFCKRHRLDIKKTSRTLEGLNFERKQHRPPVKNHSPVGAYKVEIIKKEQEELFENEDT